MPQMAPINWLILFIFIIIMMLIISSLSYFNNYSQSKKLMFKKEVKTIWKW